LDFLWYFTVVLAWFINTDLPTVDAFTWAIFYHKAACLRATVAERLALPRLDICFPPPLMQTFAVSGFTHFYEHDTGFP